ncbi:4-amino-4-deoxy-L-arabinose-phosphoundecaprenol flippase subunit ArnE [Paraliobacillus ryukyuensis]|uniref:EamA-like transporter family protein n=1 Tax=Paraliobacillus ryukyuensis TaxID=200904 RepID=A0A366EDV5_9BACI|nr:EamA-like transporter family protein [Paraliobacillus ryukyuensis]
MVLSLLFGGICYGSGALLNIYVLKKVDYTVVFPLTSITYIWTFLIAALFLKEPMTLRKLVGVVCIILGTILII